ncbi:MAG: ABC transporter substrate-binding protein, partial [Calditrichia bacterium]
MPVTESFGDRLVIGTCSQPPWDFNPYRITSTFQEDIYHMIFGHGLIQVPSFREISPALLDRIVYDPTGAANRIWRVVLNRNIVFHDGTFMLNSDVKFTFELVKKYGGFFLNHRLDFSNIKEVTINGDLDIKFELYKPDPDFYEKLTEIPILPRNYYAEAMERGYRVFKEKPPMGCGPFVFIFQNDTALNLRFHPNFYGGRPFLEDIWVEYFEDEGQLIGAFTNRSVDFIEVPDRVTAQTLHKLLGSNAIVFTIPRPETKVYFILINLRKFPLSELEVRRALDNAINREEIVKKFDFKEAANTL